MLLARHGLIRGFNETVHLDLILNNHHRIGYFMPANYFNSISNQKNKTDYAELNHVKYGLLSVEEWKRQITVILTEEINKLDLSGTDERDLRKHVEVLLNTLIDKIDKKIREENSGSAKGRVKQSFINIFISLKDIKKGIPEYADAVIHEIKKSKTRGQIKTLLNKQLEQYSNQTFTTAGYISNKPHPSWDWF